MFFLKELPTQKILKQYAKQFPEMDLEKTEAALTMLRQASLLIRKLDAYFAEQGLSQTRFLILIVLDREPDLGQFTMKDIVSRLDVSKVVITNTLKALEKEGLVEVKDCIEDRRAKKIEITKKGCSKLKSILPGYYRLINNEMRSTDSNTR
ncbi:MarR family winged helix-turn-helix transcriptional regulator [Zooshikella harenae]|uniref:MarR family transcriptional regulator n=1 Tax=Zooshikella harenae TaxID=2827238 RepID=A0ABS5ZCL8_9GAMM|nr:MarR family transcriptional regulator [Zooshikella harenae]MBU2711804.1 MarR family transcriptional regulator [Zooshikella harenae]